MVTGIDLWNVCAASGQIEDRSDRKKNELSQEELNEKISL